MIFVLHFIIKTNILISHYCIKFHYTSTKSNLQYYTSLNGFFVGKQMGVLNVKTCITYPHDQFFCKKQYVLIWYFYYLFNGFFLTIFYVFLRFTFCTNSSLFFTIFYSFLCLRFRLRFTYFLRYDFLFLLRFSFTFAILRFFLLCTIILYVKKT